MKTVPLLVLAAVGAILVTGCQSASHSRNLGSPGDAAQIGTGHSSDCDYVWNGWDKPLPGPNPLGSTDSPNYRWNK